MKNRRRAFIAIFVVVTLCGALAFWRHVNRPQIEVAEKPMPDGTVIAAIPQADLKALQSADKVTLYSLYPKYFTNLQEAQKMVGFDSNLHPQELLHGYPVLGKVMLTPRQTNGIFKAFYEGISQADIWDNKSSCFNPRHSFRVERDGKVIDFVVCFACHQCIINPTGSYEKDKPMPISESPRTVFDALLKNASVPLSPM